MFVIRRPQNAQFFVGVGLRLRLNAVWHSNALDRELADGVDPRSSAVLALRAQKLTGPRGRERIADGLAGARRSAEDNRPGISAAVRPDARELLEARTVLAVLERRLRGSGPVTAQGAAMLGVLLTDATSPLYRPSVWGELASRLRAAAAALEPHSTRRECDAMEREKAVLDARPLAATPLARRSGAGR